MARPLQQTENTATARAQAGVTPLHLDFQNRLVWQGADRLVLRPREFAVLRYLLEHAGELVTKETLYEVVWQAENLVVGEDALTSCIYEIRRALGETTKNPRYIETRPKYGYRFIGPFEAAPPSVSGSTPQVSSPPSACDIQWEGTPSAQSRALDLKPETFLVGREAELAQLQQWLEKALSGERQLVFVTGEAGIGKTTLIRAFLRQAAAAGDVAIGQGQCIEHYGPGEAYLPVLEAIGRLCRDPRGAFLVEWMKQHLPTWLAQMPALLSPAEREELQYRVQGATRERMLREMSEGVEMLTQQFPFVLVLEDVHWSDASTLDLVASIARRQEPARFLLIATYRPEEGMEEQHPLKTLTQELRGHGLCQDLALTPLDEAGVDEYLERRFPVSALPTHLPQVLHRVTGGNPLFLVAVVDDLVERSVIAQADGGWGTQEVIDEVVAEAPETIRQLLGKQIERLDATDQKILQAASVAGLEFSSAAVAAAAEVAVVDVEERCAMLARRQHFVQPAGLSEWPDGARAARYRFRHALYQYLWNERATPSQLQQFHQHIGERLETAYGNRASEIAAELALHFEQGRDYQRAVRYLRQAAQNALRRSAHREAVTHLTKGLELLTTFPETAERIQQELALRIALGVPLLATKGYADPEVERTYTRARYLCQQAGETPQLFPVLWGLWVFYTARGNVRVARNLGEQCLRLAHHQQEPALLLAAHHALGVTLCGAGEFASSLEHLEKALALYTSQQYHQLSFLHGQDPGVACLSHASHALWFLGYPDEALKRSREAVKLARESGHPFSLVAALAFAAWFHQLRRESGLTRDLAEEVIILSQERGFAYRLAQGTILRGWALAEQGQEEDGIAQIRQGLSAHRTTGAEVLRSYFLALLAEACEKSGRIKEGLGAVAEALAIGEKMGEHLWESELHRLKGELSLRSEEKVKSKIQKSLGDKSQSLRIRAEECFQTAIEIARSQNAKSLELRAGMSLSRLWRHQNKTTAAQRMLGKILSGFTEGYDTTDLKAAKALLQELS